MRNSDGYGRLRVHYGRTVISHLNYVVLVKRVRRAKGVPYAYVCHRRQGLCEVYTPQYIAPGTMAHELVHVLQAICIDRSIDFVDEKEHMAYTMDFLMARVFGYQTKEYISG